MKETRIPFMQALIGKVLDGSKTVTRRPVRGVSHCDRMRRDPFLKSAFGDGPVWEAADGSSEPDNWPVRCPYGYVGDILLPTETWAASFALDHVKPSELAGYGVTRDVLWYRADPEDDPDKVRGKWRPPMFMPKWASRGRLEILSVRAERLQDITEEDAKAEGVERDPSVRVSAGSRLARLGPYKSGFARSWNAAYPKMPWSLSPWVWRIEFRGVTA